MPKNKKKRSITLILRNYFITGVVVLIPIGFTLYLSRVLIGISSKIIPENINPNSYLPFAIPGVEILISVIFITIVGGLSLSFLGKRILKLIFCGFLKLSIIFKPSLILLVPPVNMTILGISLLYLVKDKIFSLKLFNPIKKRVNIEVNKKIKKILKILNNI